VSTATRRARARLAAHTRYGNADQADAARRDLAAATLVAHVRRIVSDGTPLTTEERIEIASAVLVAPGPGSA
jgi:hypothetical protein